MFRTLIAAALLIATTAHAGEFSEGKDKLTGEPTATTFTSTIDELRANERGFLMIGRFKPTRTPTVYVIAAPSGVTTCDRFKVRFIGAEGLKTVNAEELNNRACAFTLPASEVVGLAEFKVETPTYGGSSKVITIDTTELTLDNITRLCLREDADKCAAWATERTKPAAQ